MKSVILATDGSTLYSSSLDVAVEIWYGDDRDHRRVYHRCEVGASLDDVAARERLRQLYDTRHLRGELWVVPHGF